MDLGLNNKIALVTGSTVGIGYAIAHLLAQEGAVVYINGRTDKRVNEAMTKIKEKIPKAQVRPIAADLGTKKGVEEALKIIPTVDILINNLGIYEVKAFEQITDEDWLRLFEINVLSGIRLCRHYLTVMKERNWGRIVFISSESGVNIPVEMIHYGVTKTAQLAVGRGLAEMTVGTNVTVNSVLPGPTYSEGVEEFIQQVASTKKITPQEVQEEFFKTVRPSSLIKRFATSEEVAAMVAFICSERAAAVNGASLRVEGGVIRSII